MEIYFLDLCPFATAHFLIVIGGWFVNNLAVLTVGQMSFFTNAVVHCTSQSQKTEDDGENEQKGNIKILNIWLRRFRINSSAVWNIIFIRAYDYDKSKGI